MMSSAPRPFFHLQAPACAKVNKCRIMSHGVAIPEFSLNALFQKENLKYVAVATVARGK